MIARIVAFFGGVPAKAWGVIVLIAALAAGGLYLHHRWYGAGVASMQAKVDAANLRATNAESLNHGAAATIASLQMSQAQCESGRIADQASAALALADHDQAAALILSQLKQAKKQIQDLFDKSKNPTCAAWAQQPACTP